MKRRTYINTVLTGAATVLGSAVALASAAAGGDRPIQLHVDLTVDPAEEAEMLDNFKTIFAPAAAKQPGFLDAKMLKLRSTLGGKAPEGANYRFVLIFQNEELRQKWVATATHQKVWPTIEKTLKHKNYNVLLYDQS